MRYQTQPYNAFAGSPAIDAGLRGFMNRVYGTMTGGLALSAVVAWAVTATPLGSLFMTNTGYGQHLNGVGLLASLVPLAMIVVASFTDTQRWSEAATRTFYWAFTALQGVGLSGILLHYGQVNCVRALFETAAAFAGLTLWGYSTKRSLSGVGSFCIMGLFGMIGVSLISLFTGAFVPEIIMGLVGVLIFSGLTAWDTQRLKMTYIETRDDSPRLSTWGALSLYLDAVNLFMSILRVTSSRD